MSIHLIISNSHCQVKNSSSDIDALLGSALSYEDSNVRFSLRQNIRQIQRLRGMMSSNYRTTENLEGQLKRLLHINRGLEEKAVVRLYENDHTFPTGLLPRVLDALDNNKIKWTYEDIRVKPETKKPFVLKESLPPLRYYQKEACKALEEEDRGIMVAPTGTGKSMMICKMIWDLSVKTLVVTPSKGITDLLTDTLVHHFGKGKVSKLTTKSLKTNSINVINIQALVKLDPKITRDIDAVFIDEFHHSAADTYRQVNREHLKNTYYRIGLTATNFRNDGADMALESVLSEVLYEYEIRQAIEDGYLVKPTFELIDNRLTGHHRSYQKEYKEEIVLSRERNEAICGVASMHPEDSVIILVQQVEHGEILNAMLPKSSFLHGLIKDSDRQKIMRDFKSGHIKCLIGTSVIGEGIDLPCANVLVMAGGGKARSGIMQNIGRVLRIHPGKEFALVYDFVDRGSRWLSEHSLLRQEIYEIY